MKYLLSLIALIIFLTTVNAQFTCGDLLFDIRDGQYYQTVQIGQQCWMAENLNVGIFTNDSQTDNGVIEKYCYNHISDSCEIYGGLYEWDEMMAYGSSDSAMIGSTQGICPSGWHVPTHNEWTTLERAVCTSSTCITDFPYDYTTWGNLGTDEGGKLKETGTSQWIFPNTDATNSTYFKGLPSGMRSYDLTFGSLHLRGYFWSSTEYYSNNAWFRCLHYNYSTISRHYYIKDYAHSIRCIKDTNTSNSLSNYISEPYITLIYPNPNCGEFNIKIKSEVKCEFCVEISNIKGQTIVRKIYNPTNNIFDLLDISEYPKGVYFVKITSNKITKTEKVIVE